MSRQYFFKLRHIPTGKYLRKSTSKKTVYIDIVGARFESERTMSFSVKDAIEVCSEPKGEKFVFIPSEFEVINYTISEKWRSSLISSLNRHKRLI